MKILSNYSNRELNILNMSFLDVICGAMGAFLIVMVITDPDLAHGGPALGCRYGCIQRQRFAHLG